MTDSEIVGDGKGTPFTKTHKPRARRTVASFEDGDEPMRCRAKAKSLNARCTQPKVSGYEVCRLHGARGGAPIQHGRFSSRLGRFRESYEAAMASGDTLFDIRKTISLLHVRVERAAERASELDTPQYRLRAQALYEKVSNATTTDSMRLAIAALGEHLENGVSEDSALDTLVEVAERLAIRQEKAWGIKLNANNAINKNELDGVLTYFFTVVVEEADGPTAKRILDRLDQKLVGKGSGGQ